MSLQELSGIEKPGIIIAAVEEHHGITVRLCGNADSRIKDDLQAFLLETHGLVQKRRIPRVNIDLRELEFMNSACFKAFVFWFAELRGLAREQQYRIYFLSNPTIHWQRRSLRALSCFAAGLVHIEH